MFRAHDPERDCPVAVKLFTLDLPPERVHQLVAEFEWLIAATLDHPALTAPIAAGIVDASAYLVCDFVDAQSLDLVVREHGAAPPVHAARVATQLAGALDFAAAVNVVHGALHPRDILLSANEVRITGVGVSRALESVGVTPPVRRPYAAPERADNQPWDRRADIFSLAALVHELLWARRITMAGDDVTATITATGGGDLAALRAAFARAFAVDPAARFATALEFADALSQAVPDTTSPATEILLPSVPIEDNLESHAGPTSPETPDTAPEPMLPLDDETTIVAAGPPSRVFSSRRRAERKKEVDEEATLVGVRPAAPDVDLKAAEEQRYQDVEVAPSIVEPILQEQPKPPATGESEAGAHGAGAHSGGLPTPDDDAATIIRAPRFRHESPSSRWPVAAALAIGIGIGFLSGYIVASRERAELVSAAVATPATPTAPAGAAPTSGREFTESAVTPGAQKTAPGAQNQPATGNQSPKSATGRVLVRSTPAGARVLIDGRDYGVTPIAVRELSDGAHDIRVTRDGYAPADRRVVITASRPAQSITVPLDRASASAAAPDRPPAAVGGIDRYVGRLVVDSRPTGAQVFVDGKLAGRTPLSMRDVRAGEHVIRLEHDGYRRWSSSVRVVAAEQNRVTASLER